MSADTGLLTFLHHVCAFKSQPWMYIFFYCPPRSLAQALDSVCLFALKTGHLYVWITVYSMCLACGRPVSLCFCCFVWRLLLQKVLPAKEYLLPIKSQSMSKSIYVNCIYSKLFHFYTSDFPVFLSPFGNIDTQCSWHFLGSKTAWGRESIQRSIQAFRCSSGQRSSFLASTLAGRMMGTCQSSYQDTVV